MRVDLFDFELPPERIALTPARPRDASRMLHIATDGLHDRMTRELPAMLRKGDLLVLNDTKVIPAQLTGFRASRTEGGRDIEIEATLHKRLTSGDSTMMQWRAFLRPAKRVRNGDIIRFGDDFTANVENRIGAECVLRFDDDGAAFDAKLAVHGAPPLPPYIARKRELSAQDAEAYQTIFAEEPGSVAAPTAGLHFTEAMFSGLGAAGIERIAVTLHVGAGTFLPVSTDDTEQHSMHSEWGEITVDQAAMINRVRDSGGRIIAVGTTALRLLESAADAGGFIKPFIGETDIFITPGYDFRIVDMLLTNFHLPRSTLFMLVCAFCGIERMKAAYAHAIESQYRFYSYGDACLLERHE